MKYVILDIHDLPTPVLFPATLQHKDVAGCFPKSMVLSAGFCTVVNNEVEVFGESESLKVHSHRRDAKIIDLFLHQDDNLKQVGPSPK